MDWLPEQNKQTSKRALKKEAAKARRAKFAELQADRKKQAAEANSEHLKESIAKRNYHSHFEVQRMNKEFSQTTASASSTEAQTAFPNTAEGHSGIQTIQTMTNPLAQVSPPNESVKRSAASIPELTIPGSAEKAASRRNKGKGKGGASSGLSDALAATAISPAPPNRPK